MTRKIKIVSSQDEFYDTVSVRVSFTLSMRLQFRMQAIHIQNLICEQTKREVACFKYNGKTNRSVVFVFFTEFYNVSTLITSELYQFEGSIPQ